MEHLTSFNLGIWGIGWDSLPVNSPLKPFIKGGVVRPAEWVKIYNASKIVLNISLQEVVEDEANYQRGGGNALSMCNTKFFEILGCGRLQVADAVADGLTLFSHNEHLVYYRNGSELFELTRYYLEHEEERERIAQNGRRIALKKHTYEQRIKEMLSIIER